MAGSVNKAIVIGNLGKDPEVRYTNSGSAVCNFTVATNEQWKDKSGQKQERTEWHRIVTWGRTAELCGEYLAKGRTVYVEGRLQTRDWQDRDGNKRYTTEIVAQTVQFLDRAGQGGGGQSGGGSQSGGGGQGGGGQSGGGQGGGGQGGGGQSGGGRGSDDFGPPPPGFESGGSDDDIPF